MWMRFLIGLLSLVPSLATAVTLQPGDVILISQPCFMCSLIELEEGLPYSHGGVVVKAPDGSLSILEALNHIDRVPINVFLARRRVGTEPLYLRPRVQPRFSHNPARFNAWLLAVFNQRFAQHSYDPDFLWNNRDDNGEKYYCSEFIAKLLAPALTAPVKTSPMHFQKYREYWLKYFKNTGIASPPDGKPGLSPAGLVRSPSFDRL